MNFDKSVDSNVVANPEAENLKQNSEPTQTDEEKRMMAEANEILSGKTEQAKKDGEAHSNVLKSIEDLKNPEGDNIENIKQKIAKYKQVLEDWSSVINITASNSGPGGVEFIGKGGDLEALAKRYPGLAAIQEQLSVVKEKNKRKGFLGMKAGELDDYSAQIIKNYLTNGSMGRFTNESAQIKAKEVVDKFLQENRSESQEESVGVTPQNLAEAILGEQTVHFYKEEIERMSDRVEKLKQAA